MIKEVAIEPEVMATWQHFRELWEDLGASRGRLVAEYPSNWREQVVRLALGKSATKAGTIMAKLKPGPGNMTVPKWVPTNRPYQAGNPNDRGLWLKNAESHPAATAFDAIVASANPRDKSRVLVAGEFPKDQPPWKVTAQIEVPRTPADLLACARRLLDFSDELMLVDPNFDATFPRFRDPLAAFVNARAKGRPWRRCELHTAHPPRPDQPDKKTLGVHCHNARYHLPKLVPTGSTLAVHYWCRKPRGKKLHARFILTELGGIQYDYGLDEGESPGDTTIVSLMGEDLWQAVRADYTCPSPSFTLMPDCVMKIEGRG